MRPISLGSPVGKSLEAKIDWIIRSMREIERASQEPEVASYGRAFTATNVTASRTFDANTATVAELSDVVGTLISDMAKGGSKRT